MVENNSESADHVVIPGRTLVAGWKTPAPEPDKIVPLPIAHYVSNKKCYGLILKAAISLLISVPAMLFIDFLANTGRLHYRNGQPMSFTFGAVGITAITAFGIWDAVRTLDCGIVAAKALATDRRVLYLNRKEFWHFQLAKPILIEDIVNAVGVYGKNSCITIKTKTPIELAFQTPRNMGRDKFKFTFDASLASPYQIFGANFHPPLSKTLSDALQVLTRA